MAPAHPPVSIVVCTYQRRALVAEAVARLQTLAYPGPLDIIVIVDGSTDGTREALEAGEYRIPTRIISQPNAGLAAARNRGAAEATGEIVLFLDDDMMVEPDLVCEHARTHGEGADAVIGDIPLDEGSPPGFLTDGVAAWSENSARHTARIGKLRPFHIFGGQLSVRRDVFHELGGFDTEFTRGGHYGQEDADFGVRLLQRHDVRFNPRAISHHRYIVTPRENMRRAFSSGRSDMMFIRRHPSLARELFEFHKIDRRRVRLVLMNLARLPLFPRLFAACAWGMAAVALETPLRRNRWVARVYHAAQQIAYWSSIHRHGHGYPDARQATVLCYHAIADHAHDPTLALYSIAPDRFAAQLDSLLAQDYTFVSPDDYLACLKGRITLPRRSLLLTFDDCYTDLLETARDILRPRRIPALAFAVTGMASGTNEWDQRAGVQPLPLLDREGLRAAQALGVEIGSHSRSHRLMAQLDEVQQEAEAAGSRADLAKLGLPRPRFFAFPHGVRDRASMAAVERAGYEAAFSLAVDDARAPRNFYDIERVMVLATDGPLRFAAKVRHPRPYFLAARLRRWVLRRISRTAPARPASGGELPA